MAREVGRGARGSGGRDRELYGGLIRLHILHHASEEPIFGLAIIEELATHGYRLSPGTLYPMLHAMERKGYLRARVKRVGRRSRKVYAITRRGSAAFQEARGKVKELFGELF